MTFERAHNCTEIPIDCDKINDALSIYNPEFIFIKEAIWSQEKIVAKFSVNEYPFTGGRHLNYLTAPLLMLLLSQAGYVFIKANIDFGIFPLQELDSNSFYLSRDNGSIIFTEFRDIKFKTKTLLPACDIRIDLTPIRAHRNRSAAVADVKFAGNNGQFSGIFRVAMMLG